MNYRHICTAAMIANHGLRTAHTAARLLGKDEDKIEIERAFELHSLRLMYMRHIILEIANIADVVGKSRAMFEKHRELGAQHSECKKAFEFCTYIRNKYVAHLVPELTDKTFEWEPAANHTIGKLSAEEQFALSLFLLETVINTYTDPSTGHKIFESDTTLSYPPDETRFLNFLGETAENALELSESLIVVAKEYVELPDMKKDWLALMIRAGKTKFGFLKK